AHASRRPRRLRHGNGARIPRRGRPEPRAPVPRERRPARDRDAVERRGFVDPRARANSAPALAGGGLGGGRASHRADRDAEERRSETELTPAMGRVPADRGHLTGEGALYAVTDNR